VNSRIRQLDSEIADLQSKEEAIERALRQLAPVTPGTGEGRIQIEDYTGHVGEVKHRQWDALWAEKERVQSELRRRDKELYRLTHPRRP